MGRILHDAVKDGKEKESKKNYFLIHFFLVIFHALCYTSSIIKLGVSLDQNTGRTGDETPRVGDWSLAKKKPPLRANENPLDHFNIKTHTLSSTKNKKNESENFPSNSCKVESPPFRIPHKASKVKKDSHCFDFHFPMIGEKRKGGYGVLFP
jgi:hypothetical protein